MNKLDKKSNKSHDQKSNTSSSGNSSEFLPIGLGALLDKVYGVLGKLAKWLDENLVESFLLSHFEVCFVASFICDSYYFLLIEVKVGRRSVG